MASDTEKFNGLADSLKAVADGYEQYTQQLYAAYPGGAAAAGFVTKEAFLAMHTGPVKSGWEGYQATKQQHLAAYAGKTYKQEVVSPYTEHNVSREDLEAASPFIRLVLERMLDLLDSEATWTKGRLAADAANEHSMDSDLEHAERWCILGAQAKALHDLQLQPQGKHGELDEARRKVVGAVSAFFKQASLEDHGTGIPSWNDASGTDYEDVRLWMKTLFDRIP